MPVLLALGVGLAGGLVIGKGIDGTSRLVQWGVIGAGGYIAAKHFKVL